MDLKEEYEKQSRFSVGTYRIDNISYYEEDYVKWLENKVLKRSLLPEFLMRDLNNRVITSVIGSTDVTEEWNRFLS